MNITCIVSNSPGHLDFGGQGFLNLSKQLLGHGHNIKWVCYGKNRVSVDKAGLSTLEMQNVQRLNIAKFIDPNDPTTIHLENHDLHESQDAILTLKDILVKEKTDIALVDRNLSLAPIACDLANVRAISVGGVGGYWERRNSGVYPRARPIKHYNTIALKLQELLGLKIRKIESFWYSSELFNICFVSRQFYQGVALPKWRNVHIYNHSTHSAHEAKQQTKTLGISFGNTGARARMLKFVSMLCSMGELPFEKIEVYTGGDAEIKEQLNQIIDKRFTLYDWVDFSQVTKNIGALCYFGGIGTFWHSVDNVIPSLIVPGGVGDQALNAKTIQDLNLGVCIGNQELKNQKLLREKLERLVCSSEIRFALQSNRERTEFDYDLDGICKTIEQVITGGAD